MRLTTSGQWLGARKTLTTDHRPPATNFVTSLISVVSFILSVGVGGAQNPPLRQSAIRGVIAADARVDLVRGDFQGLEGPVVTPDGGLYFSDIEIGRASCRERV